MKEEGKRQRDEGRTIAELTEQRVEQRGPIGQDDFVYVDISSVDREKKRIVGPKILPREKAPSRAKQILRAGDVLVSMTRPNLNAVAMVPLALDGAIGSTGFHVLRSRGAELGFLFYAVQSPDFVNAMCRKVQGALYPAVRPEDISSFILPPFSLEQQRRIVAKIEELFSELDEGVANLKKARAQLAVYRQALLKHAFEGHLTADWRAQHANQLESADQLLARIREEREARYQEDLRAWNNRKGKGDLIRDGEILTKPRKPKPPYRLDSDEEVKLAELPPGWKWMTFESLSSPAQRSIQSGPFGSSLKHSEFSEDGILVIGIDNVQKGYFSKGSQNRIPPKTYERLRKYSARPHDVLMTVMATVGRCCSVPADLETAIITKHVYRTSPNLKLVSPSFVVSALLGCPATVKAIEKDKVGQTRPGINGDILKWLPIPLPPLEEQEEIMRVVSASLEGVDALEADIDLNLQKAEALRQSILKKAFAGELVAQDPADEPASELLARIRAEREAVAAQPTKTKRRKS